MKIAVDITPLQNFHSMRGVGAVTRNFIENLGNNNNEFVFLAYDNHRLPAEELISKLVGEQKINYTIEFIYPYALAKLPKQNRLLQNFKKITPVIIIRVFRLMLQLFKASRKALGLIKLTLGLSSTKTTRSLNYLCLDIFIQFDPTILLPKLPSNTKAIIMVYDLIPYSLESEYLMRYSTSRKNQVNRRNSLSHHLDRLVYYNTIKQNYLKSKYILTISEFTKKDLLRFLKIKPDKITTTLLGVTQKTNIKTMTKPVLKINKKTGWGNMSANIDIPNKPYILYVGGADKRRKLKDIFASYNNLKARGYDISLVLAGDTMQDLDTFPNEEAKRYLEKHLTYLDDIYFAGYVDEESLHWLYTNALVFVYPTIYEGFGLPILEAMQYGTPVITYKNTSIPEVAGDSAMYAKDFLGITDHVVNLLSNPKLREKYSKLGKKQASKFSWQETSRKILKTITS